VSRPARKQAARGDPRIQVTRREAASVVTIARPEAKNALSRAMLETLVSALRAGDADPTVRCHVLTGAGGVFTGGADVKETADRRPGDPFVTARLDLWGKVAEVKKPIVAAVEGACVGGGLELILMCDAVFASDTAFFSAPEIRLGLIPGAGGTQRLPRRIGYVRAIEMCALGGRLLAHDALRYGLVNRVVLPGQALAEALGFAERIAEQAPEAVMALKRCLRLSESSGMQAGLDAERAAFLGLMAGAARNEGTRAFLEKRRPRFGGERAG